MPFHLSRLLLLLTLLTLHSTLPTLALPLPTPEQPTIQNRATLGGGRNGQLAAEAGLHGAEGADRLNNAYGCPPLPQGFHHAPGITCGPKPRFGDK
jgi:hypothetical protein